MYYYVEGLTTGAGRIMAAETSTDYTTPSKDDGLRWGAEIKRTCFNGMPNGIL